MKKYYLAMFVSLGMAGCVFATPTTTANRAPIAQPTKQPTSALEQPIVSPSSEPLPKPIPTRFAQPTRAANLVEPLQNGPRLSSTQDQIRNMFGRPLNGIEGQYDYFSAATKYPGVIYSFTISNFGYKPNSNPLQLKGQLDPNPIKLACGIGIGSSLDEVKASFGEGFSATTGQYKFRFNYTPEDKLYEIVILPANGTFSPY